MRSPAGLYLQSLLSPSTLRAWIAPVSLARERFTAAFAISTSHGEVRAEVARFLAHMERSLYAERSDQPWPEWLAERDADVLIATVFRNLSGAMRVAQEQGMRQLLNLLARHLEEERLRDYVRSRVLGWVQQLPPDERYALASEYLEELRVDPEVDVEHASQFVDAGSGSVWEGVVLAHAVRALG